MLDEIVKLISAGNYFGLAVLVIVGLFLNAKHILVLADTFKKRRIEVLKEALQSGGACEQHRTHFEEELEGEYFRLVHNVKMDKGIRDASLRCYTNLNRQIAFNHFLRARFYLTVKDGELAVSISTFDTFGYWYNWIGGISALILSISFASKISTVTSITLSAALILLFICTALVIFGLLMFSQNLSVLSAKKIEQALHQLNPPQNLPSERTMKIS